MKGELEIDNYLIKEYKKLTDQKEKKQGEKKKIKVIDSGHIKEVYIYQRGVDIEKPSIYENYNEEFKVNKITGELVGIAPTNAHTKEEIINISLKRTRENIRRQINFNFEPHNTLFLTLTFGDNLKCHEGANKRFKAYIRRLKEVHKLTFEYFAVIEYQKRGAIHYHVLINKDFIKFDILNEWHTYFNNGFIFLEKVQNMKGNDNLGAYLTAYMTKEVRSEDNESKKLYLKSKGIKKPSTIYYDNINELVELGIVTDDKLFKNLVWHSTYESEFCGEIRYFQTNDKRSQQTTEQNIHFV